MYIGLMVQEGGNTMLSTIVYSVTLDKCLNYSLIYLVGSAINSLNNQNWNIACTCI